MAKIKNKKELQKFKDDFEDWSGFSIDKNNNDLESLKAEIKNKKWSLECEISDYADKLFDRLVKCFEADDE